MMIGIGVFGLLAASLASLFVEQRVEAAERSEDFALERTVGDIAERVERIEPPPSRGPVVDDCYKGPKPGAAVGFVQVEAKFVMVIVDPVSSAGVIVPSRAASARRDTSRAMSNTDS